MSTSISLTETSMEISRKIKLKLPYDPAVSLLGSNGRTLYPITEMLAHPCSLRLHSQERGHRIRLQLKKGQGKPGTYHPARQPKLTMKTSIYSFSYVDCRFYGSLMCLDMLGSQVMQSKPDCIKGKHEKGDEDNRTHVIPERETEGRRV